jgi:hypothetical protein
MSRKSKLEAASSNGQFTSEDFSFVSGMVFIEFENLDVMFFSLCGAAGFDVLYRNGAGKPSDGG